MVWQKISKSFCSAVLPRAGLVPLCVVEPRQEPQRCWLND